MWVQQGEAVAACWRVHERSDLLASSCESHTDHYTVTKFVYATPALPEPRAFIFRQLLAFMACGAVTLIRCLLIMYPDWFLPGRRNWQRSWPGLTSWSIASWMPCVEKPIEKIRPWLSKKKHMTDVLKREFIFSAFFYRAILSLRYTTNIPSTLCARINGLIDGRRTIFKLNYYKLID